MITQVWNPCAPLLMCTIGSDHPGVEPLCPFTAVHCRQYSPRYKTPLPIYYCRSTVHSEAIITQVWNPCAPSLLCTLGSDHPGVKPLCPSTTVHCGAMIMQVWNPCAPLLPRTVGNYHQGVKSLNPLLQNTMVNDCQGVEPLCPFTTEHCGQ